MIELPTAHPDDEISMHSQGAPSRYLDARVATASQPELQLMLLDGAVRFGRQALALWDDDGQRAECERLLARTLDIAEELIRGVAAGGAEASKRFEEEYAFAFRQLALAQLNHEATPLREALRLLEFQRETWRLACERLKEAAPVAAPLAAIESFAGGPSLSLQG